MTKKAGESAIKRFKNGEPLFISRYEHDTNPTYSFKANPYYPDLKDVLKILRLKHNTQIHKEGNNKNGSYTVVKRTYITPRPCKYFHYIKYLIRIFA